MFATMDGRFGFFKILSAISILAVLAPQQISRYHFISDMILDLRISKQSPPLAILEDELLPYVDASAMVPIVGEILKASGGAKKNLNKLLAISEEFKKHKNTNLAVEPQIPATRSLTGLKLDKKSPNIAQLKKSLGADIKPEITAPLKARAEAVGTTESDADVVADLVQEESFSDYAEKIIANAETNPVRLAAVDIPTTIRKVQLAAIKEPSEVSDTPKALFTFPSWMVGGNANKQTTVVSATPSSRFADSKKRDQPKQEKLKATPHKVDILASRGLATEESSIRESSSTESTNLYKLSLSQAFISGSLEMVQGLALTGDEKISVFHQVGGSVLGYGNVRLEHGRYEIFVQNPKSGMLVAEVSRGEQIIGRTEILLPELLMNHKNTGDLKETPLQIKPVYDTIVATAKDGYATPHFDVQNIILNETLPLKKKNNGFSGTVLESTVISKVEKSGHWGSLVFGSSKQKFDHILFADSTVQALYGISKNIYSKQNTGSVYGVVKVYGKEVEGAKVEILNSNVSEADSKPIYFNSFLPDANLEATASSGTFTYVGLEPGTYVLRAQLKGKYLSSQTITIEPGFISQVEFDVQKPRLAEAFVYDLRTSQMVEADIGFLGSDKFVKSKTGRQLISLSGTEGIQILEANAQEEGYYTTRMTLDKSQKEILLPMIHQDWVNEFMTRAKTNLVPGAGMAIGLSQKTAFKVELNDGAYNEDTKIIYFNQGGQVLEAGTEAPAGGGVILINMNPGIRSIFVKYQGSQAVKLVSIAVDSSAVNVFNSPF